MKNLKEYIAEAVKIEKTGRKNWLGKEEVIVTLVEHDGIDCANLTEAEFVRLMTKDLKQAAKEYEKLGGTKRLYFYFDPKPGMSIPDVCILHIDESPARLKSCFREFRKAKQGYWFDNATGWRLCYKATKDKPTDIDVRGEGQYILPNDVQAQWDGNQRGIDKVVTDYYASKKPGEYVGD